MNDDYVERATVFNINEAPSKKRKDNSGTIRGLYARLEQRDDPRRTGGFLDEERRTIEDGAAIVNAVASSLNLTKRQREDAERRFQNLSDNFNQAYATELLAICICGIIGREDGRDYHPNNVHPRATTDNEFAGVVESAGIGYGRLFSCWNRIESDA